MQINSCYGQENVSIKQYSTVKKTNVESTNQFDKQSQSPLEYYDALCKEYPDISFRLSDDEEGQKHEWYLGFGGSMNQRGNNFGMPGQCSIEIDVSAVRRMQADESYEKQVKGWIEQSRKNYKNYEKEALADGFGYTCVHIEDDGGRPLVSVVQSHTPFSTEEEVKKLWSNEEQKKKVQIKFDAMKNELLDTYMSFVDRSIKDRVKIKGIEEYIDQEEGGSAIKGGAISE